LGNVSPVIIVPGSWKRRDLRFQAEHVATQMMQNNGFNCNAAKVIVIHRGWGQRSEFLDHLRRVLLSLPARPAYYPGAEERFRRFVESHPTVEMLGVAADGVVPPALLVGVGGDDDHLAFAEESFCSTSALTELGGTDAADFLDRAVQFCNERLAGTLNATILVDPDTAKSLGPRLDAATAALRYGAIGINIWGGAAFALGATPWGAFPGHTLDDIQSGIGFVHNGRMIDLPQKTVIKAPFFMFPKPPWFVTHGNAHRVFPRAAAIEAAPSMAKVPGLLFEALRG
jgi:acyl-CoA reductase-like NAD-dependent aldehyde dehydrogenase